jgi:hypothetical protein
MNRLILLLPLLILFSCTVQKRKYQKGFYVEHKGKALPSNLSHTIQYKSQETLQPITEQGVAENKTPAAKKETVFASADKSLSGLFPHEKKIKSPNPPDSCDMILFRDGREVNARVFEISGKEIRYKRCEMPDGPDFVSLKADVFMIRYSNGVTEHFKAEAVTKPQAAPPVRYDRLKNPKKVYSDAVISMILGIIGIVFVYYGSLHAIILGSRALRTIRSNPDVYEGAGFAKAGIILGSIKLGILLLILFFFILALV